MPKKTRIDDIARYAQVSPATVSRVLNNRSYVNAETRVAVQRAIEELHYVARPAAEKRGASKAIGLMFGDVRNPFFSDMLYHLQNEFMNCGYYVTPFSIEYDRELEKKMLQLAKRHDLAALILLSSMDTENLRLALSDIRYPVTLTDRNIEGFQGNIVIQDNFQAGYIATKYLVDLGYHEIAFLAGNTTSASSNSRVDGYRKALTNAFLSVNEAWIMPGKMSIERGYRDGLAYLDRLDQMPRAILMANDMTAIGFMEACKERRVRIPEDISVVSFDGIELSALRSVNLTTVRQPLEEMAKKICELTVASIEHPDAVKNSRVMLEPRLIVRGSACENRHGQ